LSNCHSERQRRIYLAKRIRS